MKINTIFIFIMLVFIYIIVIPIELLTTGIGETQNKQISYSGFGLNGLVIIAGIQAIIGFIIGLNISGFKKIESHYLISTKNKSKKIIFISILITIIGYILIFSLFRSNFSVASKSYLDANSSNTGSQAYAYTINLIIYSSGILLSYFLRVKKIFYSFIAGFSLIFLTFTLFDKNPFLMFLLGIFSGFRIIGNNLNLIAICKYAIVAFLILIFVKGFSFYRSDIDLLSSMLLGLKYLSLTGMDPAGPYMSIIDSYSNKSPYLLGWSYWVDIQNILPSFIYADRLPTLSESFARLNVINWQPGMGMGYSPVAEAYNNFGFYFTFINFLIFGYLWGKIWTIVRKIFVGIFKANHKLFLDFYYTFGIYLLFLTFRGTTLIFLKPLMYYFLIIMLSWALYTLLVIGHKKNECHLGS